MYHNIPLNNKEAKFASIVRRRFSQITLFVIQLSGSKLASSKPCRVCHRMMYVLHIKNVIYTDSNETFHKERVNNMITTHKSQLERNRKKIELN